MLYAKPVGKPQDSAHVARILEAVKCETQASTRQFDVKGRVFRFLKHCYDLLGSLEKTGLTQFVTCNLIDDRNVAETGFRLRREPVAGCTDIGTGKDIKQFRDNLWSFSDKGIPGVSVFLQAKGVNLFYAVFAKHEMTCL